MKKTIIIETFNHEGENVVCVYAPGFQRYDLFAQRYQKSDKKHEEEIISDGVLSVLDCIGDNAYEIGLESAFNAGQEATKEALNQSFNQTTFNLPYKDFDTWLEHIYEKNINCGDREISN